VAVKQHRFVTPPECKCTGRLKLSGGRILYSCRLLTSRMLLAIYAANAAGVIWLAQSKRRVILCVRPRNLVVQRTHQVGQHCSWGGLDERFDRHAGYELDVAQRHTEATRYISRFFSFTSSSQPSTSVLASSNYTTAPLHRGDPATQKAACSEFSASDEIPSDVQVPHQNTLPVLHSINPSTVP